MAAFSSISFYLVLFLIHFFGILAFAFRLGLHFSHLGRAYSSARFWIPVSLFRIQLCLDDFLNDFLDTIMHAWI